MTISGDLHVKLFGFRGRFKEKKRRDSQQFVDSGFHQAQAKSRGGSYEKFLEPKQTHAYTVESVGVLMKIFANTVVALSAVIMLTTPSAFAQEQKQNSAMPPLAPPMESLDSALNKLQSQSGAANPSWASAAAAAPKQNNAPSQSGQGQTSLISNGTQLAQAQSLPFPMLYVYEFSATWCPSCRKLEPITQATAGKYRDFIQFSPVNVDNNQELAQQYSVAQIPTVIVVDRQGRMLNRLVGLQQGEQLDQILNHYKQKALAALATPQ